MSAFREKLILRALAALSEIADECGKRPARKTLMLRFLLAYTFIASGERRDTKWIWDDFWQHATRPRADQPHDQVMDDCIRGTGARSALNGICREVGFDPDVDFLSMLRRHRESRAPKIKATPALVHHNDEPTDGDAA